MSLTEYMNANPIITFFLALFALIAFCVFVNNAGVALNTLFSRINAGKSEPEEPAIGKKS